MCIGLTSSLCACVVRARARINLNIYLLLIFELINDVKCNFLKYQGKVKKQSNHRRFGIIFLKINLELYILINNNKYVDLN